MVAICNLYIAASKLHAISISKSEGQRIAKLSVVKVISEVGPRLMPPLNHSNATIDQRDGTAGAVWAVIAVDAELVT